ncbi:beta strand repeat-containing protein [Novosphingobium sp.]|uniref:beta strand repeat-containing protein n=1 Tax=Novosphingobium sp. TaxID=1874826 RepID=UPI003BAA6687
MRSVLMTGASTALLATLGATQALAAGPSETTSSTNSVSVQQEFNDYSTPTAGLALNGNTEGSVNATVNNNDATAYALTNSTVTVGSSATTGNASTATGYANTATLTVNGDLNNVTGSGYATQTASSAGATTGAKVDGTTDIGIALTQQNASTAATVTDGTDMGITIDHGMSGSTAKIAGNSQSATGVLNSGVTALDTSVNSTSGSSAIGVAQSSLDGSLTASVSSLDKFSTGSGPSTTALTGSTVALSNNSQAATAVANSGSNSQAISGNDVTLAGQSDGQAKAGQTYVAAAGPDPEVPNTSAVAGYAIASRQELAVTTAGAKTVTASVDDAAGTAGYLASVTGNVTGSTLANDSNSAKALARGNEVSNATTIDANSIATGSLATPSSGTVAAIASQQDVTVATGMQTIVAQVGGAGSDGPIVSNAITGDVTGSSAITASNNSVLADAAANRGGNAITASATTINTLGTEVPSASVAGDEVSTANSAFAVANAQSVASGTSVQAGLTNSFSSQTRSTDVSTAISGSLISSSIASNGNSLAANAAGNETLGTGNAITLSGTNLATTAAIASDQTMNGTATALIGKAGTAATAPRTYVFPFTGTTTSGTFSGQTVDDGYTQSEVNFLNAQYGAGFTFSRDALTGTIYLVATGQSAGTTSFLASYTSGGSAGKLATGGAIVTVGNDITGSIVTVDLR